MVLATAFRVGAALRAAVRFLQSQVDAACAQLGAVEHFRAGRDGRIPIEFHGAIATTDAHFVARLGALVAQFVLDAQLGQTVGKVADGLVIIEVGLHDPTFRLGAEHLVPDFAVAVLLAFHGEVERVAAFVVTATAIARLLERLDDHAGLFLGLLAFGDFRAHVGHEVGQRPVEFLQALVGGGGDDVDLEAELFEFGLDEFGEFLGFRHIHLVEDDDARTFGDRNRAERQFELAGVFGELVFERLVVAHRVTAGFEGGAIDDVGDDFSTFDVTQEFEAEALALGRARNQARHVGDGVAHVAGHHYAEVRHKRGERIVGDLRFGGAHRRDQARLACGRKAHQRHVGDGLELEDDVTFLARLAQQCEARRTTGAIGQRRIAETTVAARGHDELVSCMTQVGELLAWMLRLALRSLGFEHDRAHRDGQDQVGALRTVLRVAQAHGAAFRLAMGHETVVEQAVGVRIGHEDHGTAVAAIAAVRTGQRLVFLPTDAGGTIAAVAALDMDGHSIHKITHVSTLHNRKTASIWARSFIKSVICACLRRQSRRRPCGHDARRTSRCRP